MIGQPRAPQRYQAKAPADEVGLTAAIINYATRFGRYGYRRILVLLQDDGWVVNHTRMERLWRQEGLKVPQKQPKRGRLWLSDGSCLRLRPCWPNHVWSYDFVEDRTHEGRKYRMLNVIDEFTHECIAIHGARLIASWQVIKLLECLFLLRGAPSYLRSDNGPESIAFALQQWSHNRQAKRS